DSRNSAGRSLRDVRRSRPRNNRMPLPESERQLMINSGHAHRHGPEHRGSLLRWLEHRRSAFGKDPGAWEAQTVERTVARVGYLFGPRRYFRITVDGLHHIPEAPVMLVSNHSGGTTIPDVWGLAWSWYRHFGLSRPLHILGHEMIFSNRITGRFFERC